MKLTQPLTGMAPGKGSTQHSNGDSQQTIYMQMEGKDIIHQISGTSAHPPDSECVLTYFCMSAKVEVGGRRGGEGRGGEGSGGEGIGEEGGTNPASAQVDHSYPRNDRDTERHTMDAKRSDSEDLSAQKCLHCREERERLSCCEAMIRRDEVQFFANGGRLVQELFCGRDYGVSVPQVSGLPHSLTG